MVPEAVGLPLFGPALHDVIFTSFRADFDDEQLTPATAKAPARTSALTRLAHVDCIMRLVVPRGGEDSTSHDVGRNVRLALPRLARSVLSGRATHAALARVLRVAFR